MEGSLETAQHLHLFLWCNALVLWLTARVSGQGLCRTVDIHPVPVRVRQLELERVTGNHIVSWVQVELHWSAPFHPKSRVTRQEGI